MHVSRCQSLMGIGLAMAVGCGTEPAPPAAAPAAQAPPAQSAPVQPVARTDDGQLASEVARFLETWAIKRDPKSAVDGRMAPSFSDERFLPPRAFKPGEYQKKFRSVTASSESTVSTE